MVAVSSLLSWSAAAVTVTDWARCQVAVVKISTPEERLTSPSEGVTLEVSVTVPVGAVFSATV